MVKEGEIAKVGSGLCLIEVDEEIRAGSEPAQHSKPHLESTLAEPPLTASASPDGASSTQRLHPLDPKNSLGAKSSNADNVFAAPSVRHFARQKGIDLGLLAPGSGKGGRIEKRDVEAALTVPIALRDSPAPLDHDVVVELGRTRYGMWKAMTKVSFT